MSDTTLQEPAAPPAPAASLWEDFIDIFFTPTAVFARRAAQPRWGLVMLIVTVVSVLFMLALAGPLADAFANDTMRAIQNAAPQGQVPPEALEQSMRIQTIIRPIAVAIIYPISILVVGLLVWLLGKPFGFAASVSSAIFIVTYAQIPRMLGNIPLLVSGLFFEPQSFAEAGVSLARLVPTDNLGISQALTRVDPFFLWSTLLIGIGAHVIGKVPKAQAWGLAAIIWVMGMLPMVPTILQGT